MDTLVIPSAGLGTRMRHVAPGLPKELLPVGGKPAIQHALAMGREAGCSRAVVVLGPGKEAVRQWIESPVPAHPYGEAAVREMTDLRNHLHIAFTFQERPLGEADAIATCRALVLDGRPAPFAVVYPDNIHVPESPRGPGALRVLAHALDMQNTDLVALMDPGPGSRGNADPGVSDSGRVDLAPGPYPARIRAFLPKGGGPFRQRFPGELRSCGMYVAQAHFFDFIEQARALLPDPGPGRELTDGKVRRVMLHAGVEFLGVPLPGRIFDVGNPEGFAQCRAFLGEPAFP